MCFLIVFSGDLDIFGANGSRLQEFLDLSSSLDDFCWVPRLFFFVDFRWAQLF